MRHVLRMELRRSPLRWLLPLLIALDLAMLFGRSTWWIGVWPEASAAAQLPAFFFGILLGGGAAWTAGRVHRAGTAEQLAAAMQPRWRIELPVWLSSLIFGLIAYVPGVALAFIVSAPDAGPGFLWPSYLLLGACLITLSVGIGHLAGKLWQSRFIPPIAVAVCLFGQVMVPPIRFYVLSGHVQTEVSPSALVTRFALALLLTTVALTLPPRQVVRDAGWRLNTAPIRGIAAAMLFAGLAAVVTAGPLLVARPTPVDPLCSDESPRVCVWPENRRYLGTIDAMVARLIALPDDVLKLPDTFYERGLRDASVPEAGSDFQILAGPVSVPFFLSSAVIARTVPDCEIPQDVEQQFSHEVFRIDAYLQVRALGNAAALGEGGGPPGVDIKEIMQVIHLPESGQADWVKDRLTAIRQIGANCHG